MEQIDQISSEQETPSISLSDLVLVLNLIRVTTERGAIKAEEMSAVGTVYDKLVKFLQASGALSTKDSSQETAPSQEAVN